MFSIDIIFILFVFVFLLFQYIWIKEKEFNRRKKLKDNEKTTHKT